MIIRVTKANLIETVRTSGITFDQMAGLLDQAVSTERALFIRLKETRDHRRPSGFEFYYKFVPQHLLSEDSILAYIQTEEAWTDDN